MPTSSTFWTPSPEDLAGDEGFGYFRDTWPIADVSPGEAATILDLERQLLELLDATATNEYEFDELASAIESADYDELPPGLRAVLTDKGLDDETSPLDGLEMGVAGLAFALSAAGCFPAASCRSHPTTRSWSPYPVVLFAANREHAESIRSHLLGTDCGIDVDPARPALLAVYSGSVCDLQRLATRVLQGC
jgi:hypothetical protein